MQDKKTDRIQKAKAAQSASLSSGARAFASCDGVVFPGSADQSRGLLAHELAHVVQSGSGQPLTLRTKGMKKDAASKAEMTAANGKTVRLDIGAGGAKTSAIQGRIMTQAPDEADPNQEWSIVFESIQRVL